MQPGYVIVDALVVNRSSNMGNEQIIATTKYADISIVGDRHLDSVRVGQYLPVMVCDSGYILYEPRISVRATSALHVAIPKYFKVQTDDVDATVLSAQLEQIKQMEDKCKALNQKSWKFFNDLLYAYKKQPERGGGIIKSGIKVADLINTIKNYGHVGYDNAVNGTLGLASTELPNGVTPCDIATNTAIILHLLESYYNSLRVMYEIITLHETDDSLTKHKNIWLIMNHIKL